MTEYILVDSLLVIGLITILLASRYALFVYYGQ